MKKRHFALAFFIIILALLVANIAIICIFSVMNMQDNFYNSLNVASLSIAFLSFVASSFFSLSVYLQSKKQNEINENLPKKDDQYVIANYSLFNIENEMSMFSLKADERSVVLKKHAYLIDGNGAAAGDDCNVSRLVFLPTDSMNKPTYKVLVRSLSLYSSVNDKIFEAKSENAVDCEYSANILCRGYNCICVDILKDFEQISTLLKSSAKIELELDIISVFNVNMKTVFSIYLNEERSTEDNPDKESITDLTTYTIHHTNYLIKEKSLSVFNK